MSKQKTIKNIISTSGIGLHSGKKVTLTLSPAPVNTGVVFRRSDLPHIVIPAVPESVGETKLSTTLIKGDIRISTIEHLMAAFAGIGIDNIFVDVDAPEIPIMDGSADPFVFLIKSAGIVSQSHTKRYIKITKTIEVTDGDKFVRLDPYLGFKMEFIIDFKHPVFESSSKVANFNFSSKSFMAEISRARTFGFVSDVEELRKIGLAKGASLENSVGLDEYRILNEDGLRYEDEFVRHKMLDAIGDLYLLGCPVIGSFYGCKSGHALNNLLVRKVMEEKSCWEYVSYEANLPISYLEPLLTVS